ncbi:MAG: hypothetical protein WBQ25_27045 [Nitrososphaeraceae archaeon]
MNTENDDFPFKSLSRVQWKKGKTGKHDRPNIYLPQKVKDTLELKDGDSVALIIGTKDSKNVIMVHPINAQSINSKWIDDPEIKVTILLSKATYLTSERHELIRKLIDIDSKIEDNADIIDKLRENERARKIIDEKVDEILGRVRGPTHIEDFIESLITESYNEELRSFVSSAEDLVSDICRLKKTSTALDSVYTKGLLKDDEYQKDRGELESRINSLRSTSHQVIKLLSNIT